MIPFILSWIGLFTVITNISIYLAVQSPTIYPTLQWFFGNLGNAGASILLNLQFVASNIEIIVPFGLFLFVFGKSQGEQSIITYAGVGAVVLGLIMHYWWGL